MLMESDGERLLGLWFEGEKYFNNDFIDKSKDKDLSIFQETKEWLDSYFNGDVPNFTPKLAMDNSEFRKEVWKILLSIPYGETMTYGEIAKIIAKKRGLLRMSAQAVGGAVGHNPISIIIPCHRVIGAGGNLTGYAGGLDKKVWLLEHEGLDVSYFSFPK